MRVIAGTARSLPLKTPEGWDTRPTTDRIKETLFNIMQAEIPQAVFVDLFSGSGGIGIEALSRGAKRAYFIENAPKAAACIQQNLAFTLAGIHEKQVDVIFMDPPYHCGHERQVLSLLGGMAYVTEDTLIVVEAAKDEDFSYLEEMGYRISKEKIYKTNKHMFIRKACAL